MIYQFLVVGVVANRHRCSNVALIVAIVLDGIPCVGDREGNHQVRVGIKLFVSRTVLPVSKVCNETTVLAVISSISRQWLICRLAGGGRRWRRRCGRWRIGVVPAVTILATSSTIGFGGATVTPLTTALSVPAWSVRSTSSGGCSTRSWIWCLRSAR